MSLNIDGLGSTPPPTVSGSVASGAVESNFAESLSTAQNEAVSVQLDSSFPTSPPPEVTQAISRASDAYDQLTGSGRQLHFSLSSNTGTLSIQLQDSDGNQMSTVSPSRVLRIANGENLN